MRKFLLIGVVALSLVITVGAAFGSAADLKVQGGTIQAGADFDVKLYNLAETAGWGLNPDDGTVSYVTLGLYGVTDPGSGNKIRVYVNITNKTHDIIAQGMKEYTFTGTIGNIPSLTVDFNHPVKACDIWDLHVFIEGSANSGPDVEVCPFPPP
jgi:hypothetical protein